jgi:hypothetical protein
MVLPLLIGKNSAADNVILDIGIIPILMISYCNEEQIGLIFKQFKGQDDLSRNYLITNSRRFYQWEFSKNHFISFLRDMPSFDLSSRAMILQAIMSEIKRRQLILKKEKANEAVGSHQSIPMTMATTKRFVFIDDVWDIIVSKPKKNALNLMMIMIYGPEVGIITVFASIMSYMNLLQQLVHLHPQLTIDLQKRYGTPEPRLISEFGHELIFSTEDFIYYRKGMTHSLERYYKSDTVS